RIMDSKQNTNANTRNDRKSPYQKISNQQSITTPSIPARCPILGVGVWTFAATVPRISDAQQLYAATNRVRRSGLRAEPSKGGGRAMPRKRQEDGNVRPERVGGRVSAARCGVMAERNVPQGHQQQRNCIEPWASCNDKSGHVPPPVGDGEFSATVPKNTAK